VSKLKEFPKIAKDKLPICTFFALLIITAVSAILWSQANDQGYNLGVTVMACALIAIGVAEAVDLILHKLESSIQLNFVSSAIFGLIVADSYSLGVPGMAQASDILPKALLSAPQCFLYVALISLIGEVLFKKIVGLSGRKIVNPAAAAKLVVFLPFMGTILLVKDHYASYGGGGLGIPTLAGPIGNTVINGNGLNSFASYLQSCYTLSTATTYTSLSQLMVLQKFHGWIGGASSLAVIVVGVSLFALAREHIKWRITVTYFVGVALMASIMTFIYGGDLFVRIMFEVFIGSSIFLGFFMATDPATTPKTYYGQIIFGAGLATLTVCIQTYMNFFGGSILALIVMNIVSPLLDKTNNWHLATKP